MNRELFLVLICISLYLEGALNTCIMCCFSAFTAWFEKKKIKRRKRGIQRACSPVCYDGLMNAFPFRIFHILFTGVGELWGDWISSVITRHEDLCVNVGYAVIYSARGDCGTYRAVFCAAGGCIYQHYVSRAWVCFSVKTQGIYEKMFNVLFHLRLSQTSLTYWRLFFVLKDLILQYLVLW